jgi:hypothetical protein
VNDLCSPACGVIQQSVWDTSPQNARQNVIYQGAAIRTHPHLGWMVFSRAMHNLDFDFSSTIGDSQWPKQSLALSKQ